MGKRCIPFFLLLISYTVFAQTFHFRNYTEKDGLPDIFVFSVLQDSRGYIWSGTRNGLCRFDGVNFDVFTKANGLVENYVTSIFEDAGGALWIGTHNGAISRYRKGEFENFLPRPRHLSHFINSGLEDGNGILWFATDTGLLRFDKNDYSRRSAAGTRPSAHSNFTLFTTDDGLPSGVVSDIAVDEKGTLWVGTAKGLCKYDGRDFTTYTTDTASEGANKIRAILFDSTGSLRAGTSGGLTCYRDEGIVSYTVKEGLSNNNVRSLMIDRSGDTWIGTWNGLARLSGDKITSYSTKNGLPHNFIFSVIQDTEGNIWLGTAGGLGCLKSLNLVSFTTKDGLADNAIHSIIADRKGRTWFGTHNGLNRYEKGNFKSYSTADGLISNTINTLAEDRSGNIWVGTIEGLSVLTAGGFVNYTVKNGLSSNIVLKIKKTRDGALLIGNTRGVDRFSDGKISPLPGLNLASPVAQILENSKGNTWFYSETGLYIFDGKSKTHITEKDGLPDNIIYALFEDSKGTTWIGTGNGVFRYRGGKFTGNQGEKEYPTGKCQFILEDHQGRLWFGTTNGLVCYDGKTFTSYTAQKHGLPTNNWYSGLIDGGMMWLGSADGITRLKPPPVQPLTVPPPIYITHVKVLGKEIPLSRFHRLPYNRNSVRFEFAGLSFSSPASVRYRYRLLDMDTEWRETAQRSIFYYIQPGKYRFQVKAVNGSGIESTQPAELAFEIVPAFWQTWWFKALLIVGFFSILGLTIFWRYKQVRDKRELNVRTGQLLIAQRMDLMGTLAADTVHDLKNLLAVIMGYSQAVVKSYDKSDKNYQNIEIIKETTATALHMAKQILSFSKVQKDSPGKRDLVALLDDIIKILSIPGSSMIRIHWTPPEESFYFSIHPARFQQLVMNLCLNAIQAMPEGGDLTVSLSREDNCDILLRVGDTGAGIPKEELKKVFDALYTTKPDKKGAGLGLFAVKKMLDEHNGRIEVQSEPGKGSTFSVLFPAARLE
ncbi:MAG: hypothetical protein GY757_21815 [bacterium]|nr:hypothetical protein [bacterium]